MWEDGVRDHPQGIGLDVFSVSVLKRVDLRMTFGILLRMYDENCHIYKTVT